MADGIDVTRTLPFLWSANRQSRARWTSSGLRSPNQFQCRRVLFRSQGSDVLFNVATLLVTDPAVKLLPPRQAPVPIETFAPEVDLEILWVILVDDLVQHREPGRLLDPLEFLLKRRFDSSEIQGRPDLPARDFTLLLGSRRLKSRAAMGFVEKKPLPSRHFHGLG